jgi:protein-tyrosine-phosphatase
MSEEIKSVLFVCTANICRSPMAAALFRARVVQEVPGAENWLIDSAGTWTTDGQRVSENSVRAMASRGLDIRKHRSKGVSEAYLKLFDLILVMEPEHKEALRIEFPEIAAHVFLLSEFSGPAVAVEDPYGASVEMYLQTAEIIDDYLKRGMKRILEYLG